MSGPIQNIPRGLLGLLNLKQQGQNPGTLADVVSPTLGLDPFYFNQLEVDEFSLLGATPTKSVAAAGVALAAAFSPNCVVPNNQIWYVRQCGVHCALLAAEYIRFRPVTLSGASSGGVMSLGPDYNDVVTARARTASAVAQAPFWLLPGASINLQVADVITAASIVVSLDLRVSVMQV